MIRPAHRRVIELACTKIGLDGEVFQRRVRRWGRAERIEDMTPAGYRRLVDYFLLCGFRHRSRPVLSAETHNLVQLGYAELGATRHIYETDLRRFGHVGDVRDLNGHGLLALLTTMEARGLDLDRWKGRRRTVTARQVRMLALARRSTGMGDALYYDALQLYGGVNTASDLDQRGFSLVLLFMEHEGFELPGVEGADPGLADRPGFASPQQVRLIQALWSEWSGGSDESTLNHWLERYYHVSALRFLTAASASKAITALKAMKRRGAEPSKVPA